MTTHRRNTHASQLIARRALLAGLAGAAVAAGAARAQVTAPAPAPVQPRPQPRNQPTAPTVTPQGTPQGTAPNAAPAIGGSDQAEVARVEQYLNSIRTMRSRFTQVGSDGTARGTFYLSRPG